MSNDLKKIYSPPQPPQQQEDSGPIVPAYIVTFSDMVTLLLTFFVMLLSLANVQDPEIYNKSRDAFIEHLNNYGLGILSGKKMSADLADSKPKYKVSNPDNYDNTRTIDSSREKLNRLFNKVAGEVTVMPPQITGDSVDFTASKVNFTLGSATLDESSKQYLKKFATSLQQNNDPHSIKLYVLGLADENQTPKKQWLLSAQRAEAAAKFLQKTFPSEMNWPVFSWGSGPGNGWATKNSPITKTSQILIAVLRNNGKS